MRDGINNREKACELSAQGMSMKEISNTLGVPYSTVYCWVKKTNTSVKDEKSSNADRHLCKTCRFRAGSGDRNHGIGCDYISQVGKSRGCSVEECTVYEKMARAGKAKKEKKIE